MDLSEVLQYAQEVVRQDERRRLLAYEPYGFQRQLHAASADCNQILLMAANRVGKTHSGAMEMAFHLTGLYPDWWQGRRFHRPIKAWAAGTTNDKTRDILQSALLGDPKNPAAFGTGAIPGEWITSTTRKPGIPNALSAVAVRHVAGTSVLAFKSYEMGPPAFMGESLDIVWLDEEPPYQIYSQVLARILDRKGFLYMTFTPENGATELVTDLVNSPKRGQAVINATWDDAPHLDAEAKKQILDALPAHERDMRSKGIPMLGSGVVFPVPEEQIKCAAFDCPDYFRFISAIDFGWDHPTAAVLGALDPETGTFYVTRTYRESNKKIPDHAKALREVVGSTRMVWPHDGAKHDSGSGDGLADQYRAAGLKMLPSHFTNPPGPGQKEGQGGNAVEPGIQAMLTAMETGKFKVFDTPENQAWFQEFRMYHRKDGMIVKHNDDLMSATRYAFMSKRWAKDRQPFRPSGMAILEDNPLGAYL